jgi:hypothetical protein
MPHRPMTTNATSRIPLPTERDRINPCRPFRVEEMGERATLIYKDNNLVINRYPPPTSCGRPIPSVLCDKRRHSDHAPGTHTCTPSQAAFLHDSRICPKTPTSAKCLLGQTFRVTLAGPDMERSDAPLLLRERTTTMDTTGAACLQGTDPGLRVGGYSSPSRAKHSSCHPVIQLYEGPQEMKSLFTEVSQGWIS